MDILTVSGNVLPGPVSLSIDDELIWSADTGRTMSGLMVGEVVAEKKKLSIKWGVLTRQEMQLISASIGKGFIPVVFRDEKGRTTIVGNRGTLTKEIGGYHYNGDPWFLSASANIIQR